MPDWMIPFYRRAKHDPLMWIDVTLCQALVMHSIVSWISRYLLPKLFDIECSSIPVITALALSVILTVYLIREASKFSYSPADISCMQIWLTYEGIPVIHIILIILFVVTYVIPFTIQPY